MTIKELVKRLLKNAIKDRDILRMDRGNCKHLESKKTILILIKQHDKYIMELEEIINLQEQGL